MAVPGTEGITQSGPLHVGMVVYDLVYGKKADAALLTY